MHSLGGCHWNCYMVGGQNWTQDSTHREYLKKLYVFVYIAMHLCLVSLADEKGINYRSLLLEWLSVYCLLRLLSLLR